MGTLYIQDRFEITDNEHTLVTSIILPKSEFEALDPKVVTQMEQDLFNAFVIFSTTPPPPPDPVELSDQISDTIDQISVATDTLIELNQQAIDNNIPSLPIDKVQAISDQADQLVQLQAAMPDPTPDPDPTPTPIDPGVAPVQEGGI